VGRPRFVRAAKRQIQMHPGLAPKSLVAAVLSAVLTACATGSGEPVARQKVSQGQPPPIILRLESPALASSALPSPAGEFLGPSTAGVLAAILLAYPTFGFSILYAPMGVVAGVEKATRAHECAEQWNALFGDVPAWFKATFAQVAMPDLLASEVSRLCKGPQPPIRVELATAATRQPSAQSVMDGPKTADSLVFIDVQLALRQAETSRCGARIEAIADLALARPGEAATLGKRRVAVNDEVSEANIQVWAKNPEAARVQVQQTLAKLSEKIVLAYPWLAATTIVSASEPEGTQSICSINESRRGAPIRCSYDSLDHCMKAAWKGDQAAAAAGCVPRSEVNPRWCFEKKPGEGDAELSYVENCQAVRPAEPDSPASPSAPRLWCLVDPDAGPTSCDLSTYEECAKRKPNDRFRCVLGD